MSSVSWTIPDAKSFQRFLQDKFPELQEQVSIESTLDLLENQTFVSNFLRERTPYRGLLIYHGLGSGKSAASITIAEGYVNRDVVVMLPASLQSNFRQEMKKFTTKNKYTIIHYNSPIAIQSILKQLLPAKIYKRLLNQVKLRNNDPIKVHRTRITREERLDNTEMSEFLNVVYSPEEKIKNPFDGKTVIIDEVHNLISMILGSGSRGVLMYEMLMNATDVRLVCLSGTPAINSVFELAILFNLLRGYMKLYKFQVDGKITNVSNELQEWLQKDKFINRAYMEADSFTVSKHVLGFSGGERSIYGEINIDPENNFDDSNFTMYVKERLEKEPLFQNKTIIETTIDSVPLFSDILHPSSKYEFKKRVSSKHTDNVRNQFFNFFLRDSALQNPDLFKKRIVGLVSYYSGVDKSMFPELIQHNIQNIIMSDLQCKQYANDRRIERVLEKKKSKQIKNAIENTKSSASYFRVLSRQSSLFTFPPMNEKGEQIVRPRKKNIREEFENKGLGKGKYDREIQNEMTRRLTEAIANISTWSVVPFDIARALHNFSKTHAVPFEELKKIMESNFTAMENIKPKDLTTSMKKSSLSFLSDNQQDAFQKLIAVLKYPLEVCSPKFAEILKNMNESPGLIFAYSQFRTAEGIEMFKQSLLHFGYTEYMNKETVPIKVGLICRFALEQDNPDCINWATGRIMSISNSVIKVKQCKTNNIYECTQVYPATFSLWTGTETQDKKKLESVQATFNGKDNKYGQKITILLATESGAEGISLKCVRQVHVFEPFWNDVRIEQVVGRARRVNSHMNLPEEQRNVEVFNYISVFSEAQLNGSWSVDPLIQDLCTLEDIKHAEETIDEAKMLDKKKVKQRAKHLLISYSDEMTTIDDGKTSDENLMLIAKKKNAIIQQFLTMMKEVSVDCSFHKTAHLKNDIDVDCYRNIIQDGEYTYEPYLTEQSEDRFQNVRKKVTKEYYRVLRTPLFRVLIPLESEHEELNSDENKPVYNYFLYKGLLLDSSKKPFTKQIIGSFSNKKLNLTYTKDNEKWVILDKIINELEVNDSILSRKTASKIRDTFQRRWKTHVSSMKNQSLEQIIAQRMALLQ